MHVLHVLPGGERVGHALIAEKTGIVFAGETAFEFVIVGLIKPLLPVLLHDGCTPSDNLWIS